MQNDSNNTSKHFLNLEGLGYFLDKLSQQFATAEQRQQLLTAITALTERIDNLPTSSTDDSVIRERLLPFESDIRTPYPKQFPSKDVYFYSIGSSDPEDEDYNPPFATIDLWFGGLHGQENYDNAATKLEDFTYLIQTAEGALGEIRECLTRVFELAVGAYQQSSDGTMSKTDIHTRVDEINELLSEIGNTAEESSYNDKKVLSNDFGTYLRVGYAGKEPNLNPFILPTTFMRGDFEIMQTIENEVQSVITAYLTGEESLVDDAEARQFVVERFESALEALDYVIPIIDAHRDYFGTVMDSIGAILGISEELIGLHNQKRAGVITTAELYHDRRDVLSVIVRDNHNMQVDLMATRWSDSIMSSDIPIINARCNKLAEFHHFYNDWLYQFYVPNEDVQVDINQEGIGYWRIGSTFLIGGQPSVDDGIGEMEIGTTFEVF